MKVALAGNQNSGKTTLFNQLTGSNQRVSNFPGVTVERKEGKVKKEKDIIIVDLPGIYSLYPYSNEEIVTRDFLLHNEIDCIINVVDATNLERNLYLSMQLIELEIPIIVALNMMDEIKANGSKININMLENEFGIKMVPVSAIENEGINNLIKTLKYVSSSKIKPTKNFFNENIINNSINLIQQVIKKRADVLGLPVMFAAVKLIENDKKIINLLKLKQEEKNIINDAVAKMENMLGMDKYAAIAYARYNFIERVCKEAITNKKITKTHRQSVNIDKFLTNKYLAIPFFLFIMILVFWLTFGVIGKAFQNVMIQVINFIILQTDFILTKYNVNHNLSSLIVNGILTGVGTVLSFLPTLVVLFFFLSILEDTGYMARVAFIFDKLLKKVGLSGKSFVPLLMGFGCSVPAIMSTRTLLSERDRKITIFLIPFMSCSAKLPVYLIFSLAFFPNNMLLIMVLLYIIGVSISIMSSIIINKINVKKSITPFVMELPNYRLPSLKSVALMIYDKAKDFIFRACTLIFCSTIIIWFLQNFNFNFQLVNNNSNSILAVIGKFLQPVFAPIGFNNWQSSTALLAGFTAKEAVISTLSVLTNLGSADLILELNKLFTPLSAFTFLVFTLLYTPCIATIITVKNELKSIKYSLVMIIFQTTLAWIVSFFVYNIGKFLI